MATYLAEVAKKYTEIAISYGEEMANMSKVGQFIDDSVWQPESKNVYVKSDLIDFLKKKGQDYIEAIQDTKEGNELDTDLDSIYNYIYKEINFKNAARQIQVASPKQFISNSANDGEDTSGYDYAKSLDFGYTQKDVENSVDKDNPISDPEYSAKNKEDAVNKFYQDLKKRLGQE